MIFKYMISGRKARLIDDHIPGSKYRKEGLNWLRAFSLVLLEDFFLLYAIYQYRDIFKPNKLNPRSNFQSRDAVVACHTIVWLPCFRFMRVGTVPACQIQLYYRNGARIRKPNSIYIS